MAGWFAPLHIELAVLFFVVLMLLLHGKTIIKDLFYGTIGCGVLLAKGVWLVIKWGAILFIAYEGTIFLSTVIPLIFKQF